MKLLKITDGFVTQVFDTETGKYESQNFTAGDSSYEDQRGNTLSADRMKQHNFGPLSEKEPYLPFDMVQPTTELSIALKSCREQIQEDLLTLCDLWHQHFHYSEFKTKVCQIVVDNFKKL